MYYVKKFSFSDLLVFFHFFKVKSPFFNHREFQLSFFGVLTPCNLIFLSPIRLSRNSQTTSQHTMTKRQRYSISYTADGFRIFRLSDKSFTPIVLTPRLSLVPVPVRVPSESQKSKTEILKEFLQ
jgi:hypothetical protein